MKINLEQAKQVAERLKKKYKHSKTDCPEWFRNAITYMEQDGSFSVAVCVPNWKSVPEEQSNAFLVPIDGVRISLRVTTPPSYIKSKKDEDEKDKRGSDR